MLRGEPHTSVGVVPGDYYCKSLKGTTNIKNVVYSAADDGPKIHDSHPHKVYYFYVPLVSYGSVNSLRGASILNTIALRFRNYQDLLDGLLCRIIINSMSYPVLRRKEKP